MSRLPRLYVPGLPQLVLQRGNNRLPIFLDAADYEQYRSHLREAAREANVAIHAYVLMPDHAHLLVTPQSESAVGNLMQRLGRRYVRYFNDKHARSGTLWEGRYRSTVVEPNAFLLACYRYIELNPCRAGLVNEPAHYAWSSCSHHLGLTRDPLITDHPLYWSLGNTPFERQAHYRDFLNDGPLGSELAQIRYAAHRGWLLGAVTGEWQDLPNRRANPGRRGRPMKSAD